MAALAMTSALRAQVPEVEPNNTFAQADMSSVQVNGTSAITGAISPLADKDYFRVTVPASQIVRFETFDSSGADCAGAAQTTVLRVYDPGGTQLHTDATSGIGNCSAIAVRLVEGTYYVSVEESNNNAVLPAYQLHVVLHTDLGAEVEPNDTQGAASPLAVAGNGFVLGSHTQNVDSDFYSVVLPAPGDLRAEIVEGSTAETCESLGIDSRLTLYGSDGTQLADDDDDGRGWCSLIDGRGAAPLDAAAHALPAGTYYLQVRASTFSQASAAGQFDYRLVVRSAAEPLPVRLMRLRID